MYILDINQLIEGDILLTSEKTLKSKGIRLTTFSEFSHALLYVGNGSFIHSDGEGVHSGNIQRLLFEKESDVLVLRVSDREISKNTCIYARTKIGTKYSLKEAVRTNLGKIKSQEDNRQFCSRLVAQSYEKAGLKIVGNSDYCSPEELRSSYQTVEVEHSVRAVSPAEVKFSKSENPIKNQATITNSILEKARTLTGFDIQTFEQLLNYLIDNKKHDNGITQIINESGYLFMWQHDVSANPWRYDENEFLKIPVSKEDLRSRALEEISHARREKERHSLMYEQFMQVWQSTQLKYAAINIQLYQKLIELSERRVSVASQVLENT